MWKTVCVSFYDSSTLPLISKIRHWYRLSVSLQDLRKFWRSKFTPSDLQGCLPFPSKALAMTTALMKSNVLTLQWPLWLQGAQLRQRHWSLAVTKCWLSISRRLLEKIPSDISGFFSRLVCVSVCVCENVTRQKIFNLLLCGRDSKKDQFKRAV